MPRAASALVFLAASFVATVFVSAPATPASALSCGNRLVVVGDSAAEVRGVCGEPMSMMTRTETRTQFVAGTVPGGGSAGQVISVTVQIDTWVYDFGRRRFMEELIFENGVLIRMRSLGYGTSSGGRRSAIDRIEIDHARITIRPREVVLMRSRVAA